MRILAILAVTMPLAAGCVMDKSAAGKSVLPTELNTKVLLNQTPRHGAAPQQPGIQQGSVMTFQPV